MALFGDAHVDNDVPCIRMEGWKVAGGLPLSLASLCRYLIDLATGSR